MGKQGKHILKNLKILKLPVGVITDEWDLFLVNCNHQLESCKGLCLRFIAKGAG